MPPFTHARTHAVLDDSYRRALAVHEDRLFSQFELAHHGGVLEAVSSLPANASSIAAVAAHAFHRLEHALAVPGQLPCMLRHMPLRHQAAQLGLAVTMPCC